MILFRLVFLLLLIAVAWSAGAQSQETPTKVAIISLNDSVLGKEISKAYAESFRAAGLNVLDSDLVKTAAQGSGYAPSTNMALSEARAFGSVIGSEFYVLIDAQTLRRSPSSGQIYFDSLAALFLVSSRTGRLWRFQWLKLNAPTPERAEKHLLTTVADSKMADPLLDDVRRADKEERTARESAVGRDIPVIETAPDSDEIAAAEGMQLPRPFRRLQPRYPETAASGEVEAVVDVLVDIDKKGEVSHAEIARWAGFGLDEATLDTVRKLHFFPALRDGSPIPLRVLLRYNFRKPPK